MTLLATLAILLQLSLGLPRPSTVGVAAPPSVSQPSAGRSRALADTNPLIPALLTEFRKRNPAIVRGGVADLRQSSPGRYIAVGWGSTEDQEFHGRFEDWLLGIFVIDSTLGRVERVLEIMPTPRWGDYTISIQTLTPYRVTLRGEGGYGDGVILRACDIGDAVSAAVAEAARRIVRLPPSRFPQLPRVVRRQLESDGCLVPQGAKEAGPHNVVSGQFAAAGQVDWAILCSIEGQSSIRIFWGGYSSCRGPVVEWVAPDWALLDVRDLGWDTVVRTMSAQQVVAAAEDVGVKLAPPVHEAVFEKYCEDGTWLDLHAIP